MHGGRHLDPRPRRTRIVRAIDIRYPRLTLVKFAMINPHGLDRMTVKKTSNKQKDVKQDANLTVTD